MDASTKLSLRAKLGLAPSSAREKAPRERASSLRRARVPHFKIKPYLAGFHVQDMRLTNESVCDAVCCMLETQDIAFRRIPHHVTRLRSVCEHCGELAVIEDEHEGTEVCESCGVVKSDLVMRRGFESHEANAPCERREFAFASAGCGADDGYRLLKECEKRIEGVLTTNAFDFDAAVSILLDFIETSGAEEVRAATAAAAVVVACHESAIRAAVRDSDRVPTGHGASPSFACQKCGHVMTTHKEFRNHRCDRGGLKNYKHVI